MGSRNREPEPTNREPEPLHAWSAVLWIGIRENDPERVLRARCMLARHCGILLSPDPALGETDAEEEALLADLAREHRSLGRQFGC